MELIILGSGTAALQFDRGPSGYLLKNEKETFLIDSGTGTLLKCLKAGVSYQEIDRIFYSHLHPDHTIDLIPFLFATKYTPGFERKKPLHIYGPIGFNDFFQKFIDLFGRKMIDVPFEIHIRELAKDTIDFELLTLSTDLMAHADNAIGYRFENKFGSIVYSGDTDMCSEIISLAHKANILILECSFHDDHKMAGHLTPSEAGQIAQNAEVSKLVLTHIYPPFEADEYCRSAANQFNGKVVVAHDFMHLTI